MTSYQYLLTVRKMRIVLHSDGTAMWEDECDLGRAGYKWLPYRELTIEEYKEMHGE